jgi:SAM-dependent methyltransferase
MPAISDAGLAVPSPADAIVPVHAADDLSFEALASSYNFRNTSDARLVFSRLIIKEALKRPGARVLDIGCGRGLGRQPQFVPAMRPYFGELWGVEPDKTVEPAPGLFDRVEHALLEDADLPDGGFDLAYSFMVMEHVTNPAAFMATVARILKPGGCYMFATPCGGHYFTRAAGLFSRLGIDEVILSLIMRKKKEEYHYPVAYRLNTPRQISRVCAQVGLPPAECAFIEPVGPVGYMPGPLRPVYHALALKRKLIHHRGALLTLIGRITKPA